MTTPDYVADHFRKYQLWRLKPLIECADGYRYSVQASETHYCHPRENNLVEYAQLEVLGSRHREPEGWVDRANINNRIKRHGGLA